MSADKIEKTSKSSKSSNPNEFDEINDELVEDIKEFDERLMNLSFMECVKRYPQAIFWSFFISTCIIMEGYDIAIVNNFYGFAQFNRKYGDQLEDGTYQVPARWQSGLSNGANCGEFLGLLLNGIISERLGYRKTLIVCLIWVCAFITLFFCAQNRTTLLMGEILCGIPWGIFQTLTISYAADICPPKLRAHLTTYVNACWGFGQVIGVGIIKGMLHREDQWAYRIPYAVQWVWPVPLIVGIFFAPESPWWLVRKGRIAEAKEAQYRLISKRYVPSEDERRTEASNSVASILINYNSDKHAMEKEYHEEGREFSESKKSSWFKFGRETDTTVARENNYIDCFRGSNLRRTEIVCFVWAIQNLSGDSFSNYSSYFLQQAGLSDDDAYSFSIGQYALNAVGVLGAWYLMALAVGRRALYFWGLCGLCIMLLVMGFLGLVPHSHLREASLATGSLMLCWALIYQLTVGTVCFTIVAEIPARRLQIKTVALGRMCYIIVAIVCAVLTPYMLNPSAWNWKNYAGFFWGGICFLCIIYTYFRIPETQFLNYTEIDALFQQKVSARDFAKVGKTIKETAYQNVDLDNNDRKHVGVAKSGVEFSHVEDIDSTSSV